ncbi:hypothetical protein CR513_38364, partial [Mucuna pruriens]
MIAKTKIDVHAGTLLMEFGDTLVQFNIFKAMKHPTENHSLFGIDLIDELVEECLQLDNSNGDISDFAGDTNAFDCLGLRYLSYKREIGNCTTHTTQFNILSRVLLCLCLMYPSVTTTVRHLPPKSFVLNCYLSSFVHCLKVKIAIVSSVSQGSSGIVVENSVMVASCSRGRSGWGTRGILRNGKGDRGRLICSHCGKERHIQNRCYDLIGWPDKTENISSSDTPSNERTGSQLISDEEYEEFLRLKSNNHTQSSTPPSVSTACISQSMGSQGPWIINSGPEYGPADWQRT